jgi:hypothetical protein
VIGEGKGGRQGTAKLAGKTSQVKEGKAGKAR